VFVPLSIVCTAVLQLAAVLLSAAQWKHGRSVKPVVYHRSRRVIRRSTVGLRLVAPDRCRKLRYLQYAVST
jgi:hypothetical protein